MIVCNHIHYDSNRDGWSYYCRWEEEEETVSHITLLYLIFANDFCCGSICFKVNAIDCPNVKSS